MLTYLLCHAVLKLLALPLQKVVILAQSQAHLKLWTICAHTCENSLCMPHTHSERQEKSNKKKATKEKKKTKETKKETKKKWKEKRHYLVSASAASGWAKHSMTRMTAHLKCPALPHWWTTQNTRRKRCGHTSDNGAEVTQQNTKTNISINTYENLLALFFCCCCLVFVWCDIIPCDSPCQTWACSRCSASCSHRPASASSFFFLCFFFFFLFCCRRGHTDDVSIFLQHHRCNSTASANKYG